MIYLRTQITDIEATNEGYAYLKFKGNRPIEGCPGQFAMVRGDWGTDPILPRAFSLVETGILGAILVREVGKGTRALTRMRPGESLFVLGPLGRGFSIADDSRRPVLVAGGVGIAPLLFLAEKFARDLGRKPICLYGGRSAADLPLRERLAAICELRVTTEDGSLGERGVVTDALPRYLSDSEPKRVYSCGPEPMLRAVATIADSLDTPCEVAFESPMACGTGTCKGCAIQGAGGRILYVCSDGPVFDALEIYGGAR